MTLQQLRYLIAISETGSLSRASEMLYVSQPSLTGAVKEVEKEFGLTLFNRSGKGVTLTADGAEFMLHARRVYSQYESLLERYGHGGNLKTKFGVSAQHYSFAVKAFVEMMQHYDTTKYEFAIRETATRSVIDDVAAMRSEVGILYLCEFNRKAITKLLTAAHLEFHPLIECQPCVYLWRGHPLAGRESVSMADLAPYPSLSFEQGDNASFYFAEEILSTAEFPRSVRVSDRATTLNLMVGLNGYTLCSGIICEELNGDDYIAVKFADDEWTPGSTMEIGYILRKNALPSRMCRQYIEKLRDYLAPYQSASAQEAGV